MRTGTTATLAFLASSLLVTDVLARVVRRGNYLVQIEEEIRVSQEADGSLHTESPVPVTTWTELINPSSVVTSVVAVASPAIHAVVVPSSPSVTGAVFIKSPSAAAPQPTTSERESIQAPATALVTSIKPTTSSSTATAPSATQISTTFNVKRGVAFNDNSILPIFKGKVGWCYNWGQFEGSIPSGIEFVPMLWGNKDNFYATWASNAQSAIASGSTHLLAFNEPDIASQAAMSIDTAVADYQTHMQPFAGKAKLGSPAVTNGGNGMGLDYLGKFIAACSGCTIDIVALHWYSGGALDEAIAYFKSHIAQAYTTGGNRKIWITEFQYTGGDEAGFLNGVIPWLESQPYVECYSYFMASAGRLLSGSTLSTLGEAYVAV